MNGGERRSRAARCAALLAAITALVALLAPVPWGFAKHHRKPKPHRPGPTAPLSHDGRWITDAKGRVVITHGVNMVYKRPPYDPGAVGFDSADAQFLAEHGFNSVRLGTIYGAVEPHPGLYDDAYLDRIAAVQRTLARQKIFSLIDFHQDLYNERFSGEGFPDWAVIDDGLPAEPLTGFPGTYLTSPGGNQAWDNLWADRAAADGVGLQEHYAATWRHVAERFEQEPYVLGYDLFNEPWPGTQWPTCANLDGCPAFEQDSLAPMQEKAIAAIRGVDSHHLVWYEPMVITNFGAKDHHPDTGDTQAGMSFHVYCLGDALGGVPVTVPGLADMTCEQLEELAMSNAEERANENGDTLLLSEFGATDNAETITRMVERADRHMISWQWWHYCGCDDPTTQGPGDTQAIVRDPFQPPTGDNVLTDKLALIDRPYPQVVAGTPESWSFDTSSGVFELAYSATTPSGERLRRKTKTIVYVPESHFPDGYRVGVEGGRVTSAKDARLLVLRRGKSAGRVSVTVTPR
jgi:endoglycosylceramidase